ncbi:MAG: hypothetical protein ACOCVM_05815 [Desulfovibrionaceae bacterium]
MTTVFFASDIHGRERFWRKFVNAAEFFQADVLIFGGHMVGRGLQPLVREDSGQWRTVLGDAEFRARHPGELEALETRALDAGLYPVRLTSGELEELQADREAQHRLLAEQGMRQVRRFTELAEERLAPAGRRLIVIPGEHDPPEFREAAADLPSITWMELGTAWLDAHHEIVGQGPCASGDQAMVAALDAAVGGLDEVYQSIFLFSTPPSESGASRRLRPGNAALGLREAGEPSTPLVVRRTIETYQPLLSLHGGWVGEWRSMRIGRTICLSPGSACEDGLLLGCLVKLSPHAVDAVQPVQG